MGTDLKIKRELICEFDPPPPPPRKELPSSQIGDEQPLPHSIFRSDPDPIRTARLSPIGEVKKKQKTQKDFAKGAAAGLNQQDQLEFAVDLEGARQMVNAGFDIRIATKYLLRIGPDNKERVRVINHSSQLQKK